MRVDRALIIRRDGVRLSEEYAETCVKSCERHGLRYEIIDAVQFLSPKEAYESVGSFIKKDWCPEEGNACCHASHIKCWKKIVEIGRPCLILEHDALVVGRCDTVDIPDMSIVTFGFRVKHPNEYTPIREADQLVPINRSIGVHACAMTPVTAEWLIKDAESGVSVGLDKYLMMGPRVKIPLYVLEPPQVVCWNRQTTMGITSKGNIGGRGVRGAYNFQESLTRSWKLGLNNI